MLWACMKEVRTPAMHASVNQIYMQHSPAVVTPAGVTQHHRTLQVPK